jgi:hypothetical protein
MSTGTPEQDQLAERRGRAVKTALVLGVVAFAIFLAFILSGVLKS